MSRTIVRCPTCNAIVWDPAGVEAACYQCGHNRVSVYQMCTGQQVDAATLDGRYTLDFFGETVFEWECECGDTHTSTLFQGPESTS